MTTAAGEETPRVSSPRPVLADLRRARRRRRTADFDPFEALYRAYITAIVAGIAVLVLSGVIGDQRLGGSGVAQVREHGAQVVGAVCAAVWAVGLRSGGRGGPLVIEAADVRHVLMAPVDRAAALRPVAWRQLRFAALVGAASGAVAGLLAYRRLPGGPLAWIAAGALAGAVMIVGGLGLALVCSGARVGRWIGGALALLVAGWSALDVAVGSVTSPATCVGELALWPLRWSAAGLVGPAVAAAAVAVGLALVGGSSIEAAERRATLVGQIRFAATLRDLRTVVVLRRQLAQELPRQRAWLARRDRIRSDASPHLPCWRRGVQGLRRFPAFRLARLAVLGAVAGAAAVGVWRGTTPLIVVAGLAMYVAGLDAAEPLAQELDYPDRRESYPVEAGSLQLRLLGPPLLLMVLVGVVGAAVATAITRSLEALEVGLALALPSAGCGLAGAVISTVQGPPPTYGATDSLLPPEAAGARAVTRTVWPPVVAIIGVAPILAGRTDPASQAAGTVASLGVLVLLLVAAVGAWVYYRDDVHAAFRRAMQEAGAGRGASARRPTAGQR